MKEFIVEAVYTLLFFFVGIPLVIFLFFAALWWIGFVGSHAVLFFWPNF